METELSERLTFCTLTRRETNFLHVLAQWDHPKQLYFLVVCCSVSRKRG